MSPILREAHRKQGILLGKAGLITADTDLSNTLDTLLANIVTSSAIENERLHLQSVRSSLAKRLKLNNEAGYPTSDRSEGLAEMMLDAVTNLDAPLEIGRLFQWHRWLFPSGHTLLHPIEAGTLRGEEPMQVVSGRIDKPTAHFEAPPRAALKNELNTFLHWFNETKTDPGMDPLLRAGITHLWFITLHPFEDGNGRITRALTDLALAQADEQSIRLYAMAVTILERRSDYYRILEQTQRNGLDITEWLVWFLQIMEATIDAVLERIDQTLVRTRFWQQHQETSLSPAQRKALNRLLDGDFEQGISASQYQKVAKVSKATATRHLVDLMTKGCLKKLPGGGRSTRYQIRDL